MFITLLTDLGNTDAGVAKVKSILWNRMPDARLVDISHDLPPFYLQQAAYVLLSAIKNLPGDIYHVVLYNIFYQQQPQFVLAESGGKYIIAPDNGILPMALGADISNIWSCYKANTSDNLATCVTAITNILAQVAGKKTEDITLERYELQNVPTLNKARIYPNYIECSVLYIDHFENVVLNITKSEFEKAANGRPFTIVFMRDETLSSISEHYHSVATGDKLCRFNSAGYLEIAINNGKAASLFGFKLAHERQQSYDIIKINFE